MYIVRTSIYSALSRGCAGFRSVRSASVHVSRILCVSLFVLSCIFTASVFSLAGVDGNDEGMGFYDVGRHSCGLCRAWGRVAVTLLGFFNPLSYYDQIKKVEEWTKEK